MSSEMRQRTQRTHRTHKLGRLLLRCRALELLTQRQVADAVHVTQSTIGRIEAGETPRAVVRLRLQEFLIEKGYLRRAA